MESLLDDVTEIMRVRLWQTLELGGDDNQHAFECVYSLTKGEATIKNERVNAYTGIFGDKDDHYCRYTIVRAASDPYARHQHKSMFGKPDRNSDVLDKDEDGEWIVGPIVSDKLLLGFISTDTHYPDNAGKMKDIKVSEQMQAFQRFVVDVVSDILAPIFNAKAREKAMVKRVKERKEKRAGP